MTTASFLCCRLLSAHRFVRALFLFLTIVLNSFPAATFAQDQPQWIEDELLVGFSAGVSRGPASDIYGGYGAELVAELSNINVHRIRVPPTALEAIENALSHRAEVKFVERNYQLPLSFIPSDPLYSSQWHLPKIDADMAWDITQGSPQVIIAMLDTGVDGSHPDLATKMVPGYNTYDNNTNTSDVYGHGTKVAGAAAATCNNGTGVASPGCQNRIMPIRTTDTNGASYASTVANGITWAVDHGAKVINMSISGVAGNSTIKNAAQYAVNHGAVVIAAADNCGCLDSTPENPYIISVSATDSADNFASFSSYGSFVDLSAPGVSIYTTTRGGGYASASGTSLSSPIAAGVAALVMSANPALTPAQVESILETTADDRGTAGYDIYYGYGRVNAYNAVLAAANSVPPPDTTPPTVTIDSPANGATVSGGISIKVSANDNTSVSRVDLYVDGNLLGSDTTSPYSFFWDTTQAGNGSHNLVAKAIDGAGNIGTSATVSVYVQNTTSDTTPPVVSIIGVVTNPTAGKLTVSVSATDTVGVTKVELYLDGALVGTDTTSPYDFTVNTRKLSAGTHTLQAKAYDAAGNVGVSSPVSFTK